jgi:hypothetical protein
VPGHPRPAEGGFDLFAIFDLGVDPVALRLVEWTGLTGGGLLLLFVLASRRREGLQPAPAEAGATQPAAPGGTVPGVTVPGVTAPPPPGDGAPEPARPLRRDEENMPRWLRPSVQAGRQGRSLED